MTAMRLAITGASGFVGSAAAAHFAAAGHEVVRLARDAAAGAANWDVAAAGRLDAVIHLAGASVAQRWTAARARAIADRGPATERLCRSLAHLAPRPAVLVCASAIGFYGERGDERLDEQSAPGLGFLADVARAWEAATQPASDAGIRVVNLRIGMVLDPTGGALRRMLPPFRLGLGGRLGSGRQWISWITRRDLVATIQFCIERGELRGPVLATAPTPVTNLEFTKTLGAALRRPTCCPVPAFVLRLVFGRMADALLLGSLRAEPQRLLAQGFRFADPELGPALAAMLAR
jgi:uncharacterized protein (TIGR01777 family)